MLVFFILCCQTSYYSLQRNKGKSTDSTDNKGPAKKHKTAGKRSQLKSIASQDEAKAISDATQDYSSHFEDLLCSPTHLCGSGLNGQQQPDVSSSSSAAKTKKMSQDCNAAAAESPFTTLDYGDVASPFAQLQEFASPICQPDAEANNPTRVDSSTGVFQERPVENFPIIPASGLWQSQKGIPDPLVGSLGTDSLDPDTLLLMNASNVRQLGSDVKSGQLSTEKSKRTSQVDDPVSTMLERLQSLCI